MQALNNALVPLVSVPGLNLFVNQGIVLINGGEVSFPTTLIGLSANTTTWVFVNIGTATIQTNMSGFPSNSYPIAIVTTNNTGIGTLIDSRPDYVITGSNSGITGRFILSFGTPLVPGNFALSGWGSGASISVTGKDSAHQIIVTAGTSPSVAPTVILTFADGAWNSPPLVFSSIVSTQTGMILPISTTSTITNYTLTFNGLPVASKSYIASILVCGLS